jgi:hypothetical protein
MFNCVVSQSLSAINSAADSIKIISTDLWVFLMRNIITITTYSQSREGTATHTKLRNMCKENREVHTVHSLNVHFYTDQEEGRREERGGGGRDGSHPEAYLEWGRDPSQG